MSRNGSGVYSLPAGYLAVNGATIQATTHNTPLEDLETDMNTARPIVAGGTGATTAAAARTALGVEIGTNIQAFDAGLASIAGLTTAADRMIYTTASDTYAVATLTAAGRALLDDADASAQRTTLGLGTAAVAPLLDEDDMVSDSATSVPSQQSVKAYVDANTSGLVPIENRVMSGNENEAFTGFNASLYDAYEFHFHVKTPDALASFFGRTSSNGGSSYDSGASDYNQVGFTYDGTTLSGLASGARSTVLLATNIGTSGSEGGVSGKIRILFPHLAIRTRIEVEIGATDATSGLLEMRRYEAERASDADVDAFQFTANGSTIDSGEITMYGLRTA